MCCLFLRAAFCTFNFLAHPHLACLFFPPLSMLYGSFFHYFSASLQFSINSHFTYLEQWCCEFISLLGSVFQWSQPAFMKGEYSLCCLINVQFVKKCWHLHNNMLPLSRFLQNNYLACLAIVAQLLKCFGFVQLFVRWGDCSYLLLCLKV